MAVDEPLTTIIGNSILAGALVFIVKWLLSHFDKRENDRNLERNAFLAELKVISATLVEITVALRSSTAEHAQLSAVQHDILKEMQRCRDVQSG